MTTLTVFTSFHKVSTKGRQTLREGDPMIKPHVDFTDVTLVMEMMEEVAIVLLDIEAGKVADM